MPTSLSLDIGFPHFLSFNEPLTAGGGRSGMVKNILRACKGKEEGSVQAKEVLSKFTAVAICGLNGAMRKQLPKKSEIALI